MLAGDLPVLSHPATRAASASATSSAVQRSRSVPSEAGFRVNVVSSQPWRSAGESSTSCVPRPKAALALPSCSKRRLDHYRAVEGWLRGRASEFDAKARLNRSIPTPAIRARLLPNGTWAPRGPTIPDPRPRRLALDVGASSDRRPAESGSRSALSRNRVVPPSSSPRRRRRGSQNPAASRVILEGERESSCRSSPTSLRRTSGATSPER